MQAYHRCEQEMLNAERLALAADATAPALVDGKLAGRIGSTAAAARPLLVGVAKRLRPNLHAAGWRTLLALRPGQRTPIFRLSGISQGKEADMPTASWFLKLTGGHRLAPNWGYVRVDVPWVQFVGAPSRRLRLRRSPVALVDRCPVPAGELRPDARIARTDCSGRRLSQAAIHTAADLVLAAVSASWDHWGMTNMNAFLEADPSLSSVAADTGARIALGRVAAPLGHESTSGVFYFWVDHRQTVERTQIVTTSSTIGGRTVQFVGIVQEVYRRSRQKTIGEEADRFDRRSAEQPPFDSEGVTYAEVAILRTDPVAHTPPIEESPVYLGGPADAATGYGFDRIREENKLAVGRLRNGGAEFAGPAFIDLAYLLGENGGHLNVNGIAGMGTKSSFLLHVILLLMRWAKRTAKPGGTGRTQIVPIIFNVKSFDLFYIDLWSRNWKTEYADDWKVLGIDNPEPFGNVRFFATQERKSENPIRTGRDRGRGVQLGPRGCHRAGPVSLSVRRR